MQSLKAPYCVSASVQTEGKGQREKSWSSESFSNVLTSFLVDNPGDLSVLAGLNSAAALAVVSCLESFGLKNVKIKWPNDVYVDGRKIAGILTENVIALQRIKYAVVGVGLNVNQTNFENFIATSLYNETGKQFEVVDVLHNLYDSFYHFVELKSASLLLSVNEQLYKQGESVTFEVDGRIDEYIINRILANGNLSVLDSGKPVELEHHKVKWVK
jgi:BirA family biotin operon repressor/biotin-[acetyl-CoA-carboxylase] ligase